MSSKYLESLQGLDGELEFLTGELQGSHDPGGIVLREIAARPVITEGAKKCECPSPATVMRMLREHDAMAALPAPRAGDMV